MQKEAGGIGRKVTQAPQRGGREAGVIHVPTQLGTLPSPPPSLHPSLGPTINFHQALWSFLLKSSFCSRGTELDLISLVLNGDLCDTAGDPEECGRCLRGAGEPSYRTAGRRWCTVELLMEGPDFPVWK